MNTETLTAKDIFIELVSHVPPEQWNERLAQACQGNDDLQSRVRALLRAHAEPGSFLERPAIADEATVDHASSIAERPGTVIGPYKLLEQIGEGGMGVVFMAEQTEPLQRTVALKIIKPGMDTRQVIARFEAERQALALMDHPNIAKVLDAGTTDSGRPYFVMELVKGVPITRYCDEKHLPLRARLELFTQVCQAVQHAHQKGIIHRDIKPNNVLVAEYDNRAVPKVIDFGVAKATAQKLTERTMFTEFGQVLGTLEYMSPEQAKLNQLDVDTRSDIYSLGVLLYELLAGSTPFEGKRLHAAAFDEMLRIIREEEPPKPSTRLSSLSLRERAGVRVSSDLSSIAANRHTEPARLSKEVRGELDWIVMKALEKDRNRRYETANGFAADIERHLHDEPVQAGPPSAVYRLKKFVRRNKGPVLAAAVVLLTLVGGIVGTTLGLVRAEKAQRAEADRAEGESQAKQEAQAVLDFVEQKVFAAARPEGQEGGLGYDVTLRGAIEAALPFVDESFADRPLIEARLRQTLGISFLDLGEPEKAAEQFEKARAIRTKELGPDHPDTLKNMQGLANSYDDLGRYAEALKLREETLTLRKAKLGPDHPDTLESMNNLANSYFDLDRQVEALTLREEVLALQKAKLGPDHTNTLGSMNNLANSYDDLGRYAEALKLREETLTLRKAKLGPDHPDTLGSMNNLAVSYANLDRHAEALTLREEVLTLRKAKLGPDHPDTLASMNNLANSYAALDRQEEALKLREETLTLRKAKLGPDHPDTLRSMNSLASSYSALGRHDEALKLHEEVVALRKAKLGSDHSDNPQYMSALARSDLASSYFSLGNELSRREQLEEAARTFRSAIEILDPLVDDSPSIAHDRDLLRQSYQQLAVALFSLRRFDEAEQAMRGAIALYADVPIDNVAVGVDVAWTHYDFGLGLYLVGRVQDAAELFREAFRRFEHVLAQAPEGNGARTRAESALRWTLLTCPLPQFRDPDRALKLIQQSLSGKPLSGDLWNSLGIAHYRLGQWDEAIAAFQKSIELRNGGDSSDFYFLAMAHWQRGEQDEARKWYHRAVEHKENQEGSNDPNLLNFRQEAEELMGVTLPQPSTDTKPPEP